VFSVPATYEEPKGLFLLEAMASGVPVVQPRRGAFPEVVEKTGGGIIVDADNPEALADAFLELWRDPARATALGLAGAKAC
jgi:glycosyltransferase involved in cell wall biosynthesis